MLGCLASAAVDCPPRMPIIAETVKSARMVGFSLFFEIRVSCKVSILRRIGNTLAWVQVIDADGLFYGSKR